MDLRRFCTTARVVIVAGKGGVGKTTVTAALAVCAARAGLSVLIVEVEGKSGLAATFGSRDLGYEELELAPGIRARTLTPEAALADWLEGNGFGRIARRLGASGVLDVIASAVPGVQDILVLGKVRSLEQQGAYDLIVVDAPAAGHAITFLTSPAGLAEVVAAGPVRAQAAEATAMLADPQRTQVMLVTAPEETPVNEAVETAFALEDRVGVALAPVVVNGIYPRLGDPQDPDDLVAIATDAAAADLPLTEPEVADLSAAVAFRRARTAVQERQAAVLADALPLPQLRLPFVFEAEIGRPQLDALADALAAGIAALPDPLEAP
ncbi:MAG: ArsA family ATPase [Actinomycetes bacterium]